MRADAPDVFEQMRSVEQKVTELREQVTRWIASPPDDPGSRFTTIPASPDDVFWLCSRLERLLATIQDAQVTYGIIDPAKEGVEMLVTPMMVERDAVVEALYDD